MILQLLYLITLISSPYKELQWSDFKGKPNPVEIAKGMSASTTTTWDFTDSTDDNGRVWFDLSCAFVSETSWTITDNPRTLLHENTHYRIALLWAKKCIDKIAKYQGCTENKKKKVSAIYDYYWAECRKMQNLFDTETKHSLNVEMERIWEREIQQQL